MVAGEYDAARQGYNSKAELKGGCRLFRKCVHREQSEARFGLKTMNKREASH
jgi:hypothetical protein